MIFNNANLFLSICIIFCGVLFSTGTEGFVISTKEGTSELRLDGMLWTDQDIFFNVRGLSINDGTSSQLITKGNNVDRIWMRYVRPIFSGKSPYVDFIFIPDFSQGQSRLFDAFADIHYFDLFELNVGKQKSLIAGLERIGLIKDLLFVEFPYTSTMATNREIGLMLHGGLTANGYVAKHKAGYDFYTRDWFNYQIAILNGTADESDPGVNPVSPTSFNSEVATTQNKAIEARVFLNPFQTWQNYLQGLGIGISIGYDYPNNETTLPSILSIGLNPIFNYVETIAANGLRRRIHPQGYWFVGQFGLITEWTQTLQSLSEHKEPTSQEIVNHLVQQFNTAGLIAISYNLTGEHSEFNSFLKPNKPFIPFSRDSWGAFQLVGRYTWLNMDRSVFSDSYILGANIVYPFADPRTSIQKAKSWGIGLNWYLNNYLRISTEYDQTSYIGGCSTGAMSDPIKPGCLTARVEATRALNSKVINRPDEKVIFQRFALSF